MDLFSNKLFSLVLLIAFLSFCYLIAMNAYAPLAVQELMNGTAAESGSLQIPRAIITILLPGLVGTWVVKKQGRMWQALAVRPFLFLSVSWHGFHRTEYASMVCNGTVSTQWNW